MKIEVRPVIKEDIQQLKSVLSTIELFPAEMLDDLIEDYLTDPSTEEIWFTAVSDSLPVAVGYCAPEKMTEGTYNLYAIGVISNLQGAGIGSQMMSYIESELKAKGMRILIVDTSGTEEFTQTRKFYENLNYTKEAVIRDFWKEGDDKVTYWKELI